MAHTVTTFNWLHIPTGTKGTKPFTKLHAMEASSMLLPSGLPVCAALILLDRWNHSADWKYTL